MPLKTPAQLLTQIDQIRNETTPGGNSKTRIADMLLDLRDSAMRVDAAPEVTQAEIDIILDRLSAIEGNSPTPPWTPLNLPALYLWSPAYKQIMADNAPLSATLDFSGMARGGVQGTVANQGVYRTNQIAGRGAYQFISNDLITFPQAVGFVNNRTGVGIGIAWKKSANTGTSQVLFSATYNASIGSLVAVIVNDTSIIISLRRLESDTAAAITYAFTNNNFNYLIANLDFTGNLADLWVNGTQVGSGAISSAGGGNSRNSDSQTVCIGAGAGISSGLNGFILDTVLTTQKLSASEINNLNVYFASLLV